MMQQESTADGAYQPPSSSRRWLFLVVLCVVLCLPGDAADRRDLCADGYGGFGSSGFGWGSSGGGRSGSLQDVCGAGSGPFCFPSTLMMEDTGRREGSYKGNGATFQMANGGVVSCFLKGSEDGISSEGSVASCKAPHVPDVWMRTSGGPPLSVNMDTQEIEIDGLHGSSSPHVDISPPLLDWGRKTLYSPSVAFLKVANSHEDSVLHVYDLYSTNPQFYAYDFNNISLVPGQSASIEVVFLPRWLGLSSAHLVMQTNFGGFVIHTKGVATVSPYRIEPLLDGSMIRNFSLYNPFANMLHVEEVSAWLSVSSEDINDSAHVVCSINASHQSSDKSGPLLTDAWLTVKSGELGLSWVNIRPHKQWAVPPHNAITVAEMNLLPHLEGSVSGAICMQLRDSTLNRADTIIVPIKVEMHGRKVYHDVTGSISVFLEPLVLCDGRGSLFSVSARNEASYLLSVLKISVVTEGSNLFQVNYMEGLILYPKSVSRIAFISYTPVDSHSDTFEVPSLSSNCELSVVTNDSTSPGIKIPCHNFVSTCSTYQPGSSIVASEGSYIGMPLQQENEKSTNVRTGSLGIVIEEPLPTEPKFLEVAKVDELILRNWRSQGTMNEMSVIEDDELLFPAVQIGTYSSKWISVHNPSKKPVVIQLVLNSGVIVDHCKSDDDLSEHIFSSRFAHIDSREAQIGFSLSDSARTEAFVHPLSSALFGPVFFRPAKRCMWRSSALIRNNLSGIEWLPLRAFGGSHSLVLLEGSEPVRKLEFNLDLPIRVNLSSWNLLPDTEASSFSCSHLLSKELYAKNTGELPLEVLKMDISGSTCGLGGFMIHNCKGFALAPGESIKLLISYQADFSAAVVHRELELAMATGIFVIPMKAVLPVYMLKLCRKSFFRSTLWNLSILVLAAAFISCLVILFITPHASSSGTEYYFVKNDKAITTISTAAKPSRLHRNKSSSRSAVEEEKPEVSFTSEHPNCPNSTHSSTKRMQSRHELDHQKKTAVSLPFSTDKPVVVLNNSDILETPHTADLTVRVVRERGRRRKRRAAGATSAAKFDVSSSQSGNSTPSSPLSPSSANLKQMWPLSPDIADNLYSQVPEMSYQTKHVTGYAKEARAPEADKRYDNNWLLSAQDQPHVIMRSTGRPTLLPSATFPGPSWRAPGVVVPSFSASTSPIAPHARAPGSKLSKDDAIRREESDMLVKDLTYDIWGNYFSAHLLGRPKEIASKVCDASEGDSQSFFAREPQSLVMMSSARSVSPGHKFPLNNVNRLYEMD